MHSPAAALNLLLFQDVSGSSGDIHLLMIATWVIAICLVLVILGVVVGALIAYSKINALSRDAQKKAQPLLLKGQQIAGHVNDLVADLKPKVIAVSADLQPKIASISSDVQHISSVVRSKVDEAGLTFTRVNQTVQGVNETVQDVNVKTKDQVERVNGLVSEALTTTQQVSKQIQHGIRVPVEKIASWVTAAKTGIENLSERFPFLQQTAPRQTTRRTTTTPGPVPVEPTPIRSSDYPKTPKFEN